MVQSTFKINQSFYDKLTKSKKSVEDRARNRLLEIAQSLVEYSPVDTGAYVTSHTAKANNTRSRGRSRSSKGKPQFQNKQDKQFEGYQQLASDIRAFDMEDLSKVTFRNDSPHARLVEDDYGYGPYRKTKARFR